MTWEDLQMQLSAAFHRLFPYHVYKARYSYVDVNVNVSNVKRVIYLKNKILTRYYNFDKYIKH